MKFVQTISLIGSTPPTYPHPSSSLPPVLCLTFGHAGRRSSCVARTLPSPAQHNGPHCRIVAVLPSPPLLAPHQFAPLLVRRATAGELTGEGGADVSVQHFGFSSSTFICSDINISIFLTSTFSQMLNMFIKENVESVI